MGAVKKGEHPLAKLLAVFPQKMPNEVARESIGQRKIGCYILCAVGQGVAIGASFGLTQKGVDKAALATVGGKRHCLIHRRKIGDSVHIKKLVKPKLQKPTRVGCKPLRGAARQARDDIIERDAALYRAVKKGGQKPLFLFGQETRLRILKHEVDKLVLALPREEQAQGECPYVRLAHTLNGVPVARRRS